MPKSRAVLTVDDSVILDMTGTILISPFSFLSDIESQHVNLLPCYPRHTKIATALYRLSTKNRVTVVPIFVL